MTSKAHAKDDWVRDTVAIAVVREGGAGVRQVLQWEPLVIKTLTDEATAMREDDRDWLHVSKDDARAIYEALAEHFGHAGHDVRALRRDYDAERARVDRLIAHVTERKSA